MGLVTEGLTKRYRSVDALMACNLVVNEGTVFGLLGANGAGKSTLLRLLLGFLRPTAGWARISGHDCYAESVTVRRLVSYLPGDVRLFRGMGARDYLQFMGDMRGDPGALARATQIGERLELSLDRRIAYMSTGMRQKLALAAVLAADTPFIILDEPTASLDPQMRQEVASLVREQQKAHRTVIFSSHVLSEVEDVAEHVGILRRGRLVTTLRIGDIRKQHRIHGRCRGHLPPIPPEVHELVTVISADPRGVVIDTLAPLPSIWGWLGTVPWEDIRIEPLGLRRIYEQVQLDNAAEMGNSPVMNRTIAVNQESQPAGG